MLKPKDLMQDILANDTVIYETDEMLARMLIDKLWPVASGIPDKVWNKVWNVRNHILNAEYRRKKYVP